VKSSDKLNQMQAQARARNEEPDIPIEPFPGKPHDELCKCGRLANKPHCPVCGSYSIYALKRYDVVWRDGIKQVKIPRYRCQRCGECFNRDDWAFNCHAINEQAVRPGRSASDNIVKKAQQDDKWQRGLDEWLRKNRPED